MGLFPLLVVLLCDDCWVFLWCGLSFFLPGFTWLAKRWNRGHPMSFFLIYDTWLVLVAHHLLVVLSLIHRLTPPFSIASSTIKKHSQARGCCSAPHTVVSTRANEKRRAGFRLQPKKSITIRRQCGFLELGSVLQVTALLTWSWIVTPRFVCTVSVRCKLPSYVGPDCIGS